MEKIEAIYRLVDENRSAEEIKKWSRALDNLCEEIGIDLLEDRFSSPFLKYVSNLEKERFVEGFKYAMQLVKECWIWTT